MLDLDSFAHRREYEAKFDTPTDSLVTGISTRKDDVLIHKVYDVEDVLRQNQHLRNDNEAANGFNDNKTKRYIGEIPAHVAVKFMQQSEGDPFELTKLIKRYLRQNPEFSVVKQRSF